MHLIDSPNSENGKFIPGNPVTGAKPTYFTADWANMVQDELHAVLVEAGIDPDKADNTQLLFAIKKIASVSGNLVTPPQITGSTTVSIGQTVTLNAAGSISAFKKDTSPETGVTYHWTLPDATEITGNSVNVIISGVVGDEITVSCFAMDDWGNVSQTVSHDITVTGIQAPDVSGLSIDLPETLVAGEFYSGTITGATGTGILSYNISNVIGFMPFQETNQAELGVMVDGGSQSISFDVVVESDQGLMSPPVTLTRNVIPAAGSSGALGPGTHTVTVPAGVESLTITGTGGTGGSTTTTSTACPAGYSPASVTNGYAYHGCQNVADPAYFGSATCYRCIDPSMPGFSYYAADARAAETTTSTSYTTGAATTVKNGATSLHSFAGGYGGAATQSTVVKSIPATGVTLTVLVPPGGAATLDW